MSKRPILTPGDAAPWFEGICGKKPNFAFNAMGGYYNVLTFFGSLSNPNSAKAIAYIRSDLRSFFDDRKFCFFGVGIDPKDDVDGQLDEMVPGIRFFKDRGNAISALYGAFVPEENPDPDSVSYYAHTVVTDPFLRVIDTIPLGNVDEHNQRLCRLLETQPDINHYAGTPMHAPVLVLPRIFEPELCQELIERYQSHGGKESGFMREKDGNTVAVLDHSFKRRKDFNFDKAPDCADLRDRIRARISRRLVPEMKKAFQFDATRMERYLVACYDSSNTGFFNAHRDDTTKGTAHRRFACTLNLNTEEYEGGELRFPEFGRKTYRAPTGGVVIFSCSLLHEATPVTKGTRYAFLPFFYNDAAAELREENRKFLTGEVIDHNQSRIA